ncbi:MULTISPECIES: class I SAM-dependent methyltransferase [Streptomyces]|uniref:Methyltransferase domain-containing protein n=1 Tax=Streptomyces californicus TaxID=67351 RepID=A0ABD7D2X4_9ACTN|nr:MULTISPECIES: class I SAM-dependent methyltransferase [Streptomyces]NEC46022.1 methyltransferase domain-containing protein [Streptomyces sp. SID8016]MCC0576614.1 class I SAM-dependent methyltransferase [Streptomyces californicus]QRV26465.1 methyltransferase domain-containing protein [Streptomyces californicus]QRV37872.1 methyltransferase domain-containing protein [Streptomyces californicus]QRV39868.1 methyltransferase domain-containing protein [Streptomyces californicus]
MHWYEDDALWSDFAPTMFPPARAESAAALVDGSPLLDFPPGTRVLDLCCGPGLFVVPLAARGYEVTGVDLSPSMLERARAACDAAGAKARLERADMLTYREPEAFDVVLNVFTSFGYFEAAEDNLRVLRNARESLAPGGRLLVDVMGKEVLAGWIGRPKAVDLPDGSYVVQRDTVLDSWRRLRTDWTLVRGTTARTASITSWLYSAAELHALFEEAGFTDVECFGGFDASGYDQDSDRLVVRGRRP